MSRQELGPHPQVSVIIPTYNEVRNVKLLIESLLQLDVPHELEIVVVDDGSTDGTIEAIEELMAHYPRIKLLIRRGKMGLGSAYKDGLKIASGYLVVQMDGDLSHRPSELPKLLDALAEADLAIGSRYVRGGRVVNWSATRIAMSKVANLLAKLILSIRAKDITSGFRAWRRSALELCLNASICSGFDFQVEMLFIAERMGLKITEIPITFVGRRSGKSKLGPKDILSFIFSLLKMLKHMKAVKEGVFDEEGGA